MSLLKRVHFPTVKKLEYNFDPEKILQCFDTVSYEQDTINAKYAKDWMNKEYKQRTITKSSSGDEHDEHSYGELLEEYKNTYIEEVINTFKSPVTRARLIVKKPGAYILPHIDYDTTYSMRYYIPLQTNDWAFTFVRRKNGEVESHNLEADGSAYFVNPGYEHSAINLGKVDDIRLILSVNGQKDIK
tara:strand:+ start:2688 stop:3248 length:561 start_codon:yes stop_codon:yes gene_type:complete